MPRKKKTPSIVEEAEQFVAEKKTKVPISVRRMYAAAALTGLLGATYRTHPEATVREAFRWADLMSEQESKE